MTKPQALNTHTHAQSEVTNLISWQAAMERSLAEARSDIRILRKAALSLFFINVAVLFILLVIFG